MLFTYFHLRLFRESLCFGMQMTDIAEQVAMLDLKLPSRSGVASRYGSTWKVAYFRDGLVRRTATLGRTLGIFNHPLSSMGLQ